MRFLFPAFIFSFILLQLYSYTQIDLNLFLSRFDPILSGQKFFQYIGYFQRPLSTYLYLGIIVLMFALYFFILNAARKGKVQKRDVWKIIIVGAGILTFSYNAFSYDFFNYIFYGKIITFYNQNPYLRTALEFPQDPMLNFMRWTHNTYPYGPVWLGLTVPLSFLGFNFFLPTAILFKALASAAYVGTAYFISRILRKVAPGSETLGLVFFALNPLVIVESLVSSHNDIAMMFFAVTGLYFLVSRKIVSSFLYLLLSIGLKFATGLLAPLFIWSALSRNKNYEKQFLAAVVLMAIGIVLASFRSNFQPWYLLYIMPFAALLAKKYFIFIPVMVLSFSSLLMYVPYLYNGNWDPPIPTILFWINASAIGLAIILVSGKALINGKIKL